VAPTARTFELYTETDAHGGTRNVWLRLTEDGAVMLEGQDLGRGVSAFFGEDFSEYEWSWTLAPERLDLLLDSLGVTADSADLVEKLASRLKMLDRRGMEERFRQAGATFWSRVGE
jgi:hypothetical protein